MAEKNKSEGGGFFSRFFLVAAALALVVIGANPFYRRYGGVMNYIDHISKAFAEGWSRDSRTGFSRPAGQSEVVQNSSADAPGALLKSIFGDKGLPASGKPSELPPPAKGKVLDVITDSDRQKLDSLVGGM